MSSGRARGPLRVTTFVPIPGAGGDTWYWHRLVAELESRGHRALAVELPGAEHLRGPRVYAENVRAAHEGLLEKRLVFGTISFGYTGEPIPRTATPRGLRRQRCAGNAEQQEKGHAKR